MKQNLKIYNSLTGEKEIFKPLNEDKVGMYVCGPTVYSNVHLGNVRTFLSFDFIFRTLQYLGYKVRYVRNITDAGHLTDDGDVNNDRFVKQSRLEKLEPMDTACIFGISHPNVKSPESQILVHSQHAIYCTLSRTPCSSIATFIEFH